MSPNRGRAQALVEFALLAPVLLVIGLLVWDAGGVLREQLILDEAARTGARVAAAGFAANVVDAAVRAGGELGVNASDVTLSYPQGPTSPLVTVSHAHQLGTPVLRRLWGDGSGLIHLRASAQFYLPALTPAAVPTFVPSAAPCTTDLSVPALARGYAAYSAPLSVASSAGVLQAAWSASGASGQRLEVVIYRGDPFSALRTRGTNVMFGKPRGATSVADVLGAAPKVAASATGQPSGTYTVFFYNAPPSDEHDDDERSSISASQATTTFPKASCP